MKKFFLALISNTLMIGIPLIAKLFLLLHFKILILITGSTIMWLTQPAFSIAETNDKKSTDRFSVILILSMSFISVASSVLQWAYFKLHIDAISFYTLLGTLMILLGLGFRFWAVQTLGKYFTPTVQIKERHALITKGPYTFVRHPSYSGAFLCILGGSVLLESWIGLIITLFAMGIAYFVRIKIEEKELLAYFGNEYSTYSKKTKAIIPFVW